ncbi:MAG: GatB/YqeY domain-containing protein [Erysipelotrichaceae bacterium]|jgi:uncharacterized protein YqeY|nr:GatB/YqeY domain-containing protein [Erysipelotrichaceae bacterium]
MLFNELKAKNLQALKDKDAVARAVFSVAITKINLRLIELRAENKNLEDSDVIGVLKKVSKELLEEKDGYLKTGNLEQVSNVEKQLTLITAFLPRMLTETEIRAIINGLDDKSMPKIMKYFKEHYQDTADMRIVSQIAKSL